MTIMFEKIYHAFLAAGASDAAAKDVAEELVSYEIRFAKLESDMLMVKWLLALLLAGIVSLIWPT